MGPTRESLVLRSTPSPTLGGRSTIRRPAVSPAALRGLPPRLRLLRSRGSHRCSLELRDNVKTYFNDEETPVAHYSVINTTAGPVRGIAMAGTQSYLGIPYGEPTGGQNRFRPPRPRRPWSEVRDALHYAPSAPQPDIRIGPAGGDSILELLYPRAGSPTEGSRTNEDCLSLNVWAPPADAGLVRPVMVWFHGGAFQHGSGNESVFAGGHLAREEGVVVVTVNHRLGALGFTRIPSIKGSANAGMLDLVLALEWVRDNIAAFGGDPGNVTIFGQSGGSMKVAALMCMPTAEGLFHRAIMQSGPAWRFITEDVALENSSELAGRCETDLESLHRIPTTTLVDAAFDQARAAMSSGKMLDLSEGMWPGPSIEQGILPQHPFADGSPAAVAGIPLLIGSTAHDMAGLVGVPKDFDGLTDMDVQNMLGPTGVDDPAGLAAIYRRHFPSEMPYLLWTRVLTDLTFRGTSMRVSAAKATQPAAVFHYLFDQRTDAANGAFGSCHSLDLPYVFGTVDQTPLTASGQERRDVAKLMMRTWASFARSGSPAHTGLPRWPSWQESPNHAMMLGPRPQEVDLGNLVFTEQAALPTA